MLKYNKLIKLLTDFNEEIEMDIDSFVNNDINLKKLLSNANYHTSELNKSVHNLKVNK